MFSYIFLFPLVGIARSKIISDRFPICLTLYFGPYPHFPQIPPGVRMSPDVGQVSDVHPFVGRCHILLIFINLGASLPKTVLMVPIELMYQPFFILPASAIATTATAIAAATAAVAVHGGRVDAPLDLDDPPALLLELLQHPA